MKKILSYTVVLILVCATLFSFAACTKYDRVSNDVKDYTKVTLMLESGDSYEFDPDAVFSDSGLDVTKYEIEEGSNYKVRGNKIIAEGTGVSEVKVSLYVKSESCRYVCSLGTLYTYDRADMTPISTAEELAAIDDLGGRYIQTADIDLSVYADWEPIGNSPAGNEFSGMFVNPDGYKIKNLTIRSSENVSHGPYGGCHGGLFGSISGAFIYGVILENVSVELGDFTGKLQSSAGGIAASSLSSYVKDCSVEGNLCSTGSTGGIIGSMSWGCVEGCEFRGNVINVNRTDVESDITDSVSAGGIAGYCGIPFGIGGEQWGLKDCMASANVRAYGYAGGLAGYIWGVDYVTGCTFDGKVNGVNSSTLYGFSK